MKKKKKKKRSKRLKRSDWYRSDTSSSERERENESNYYFSEANGSRLFTSNWL